MWQYLQTKLYCSNFKTSLGWRQFQKVPVFTDSLHTQQEQASFTPGPLLFAWLTPQLQELIWPTFTSNSLTSDQLPSVQSAGQRMCVLQGATDTGLGMCWHWEGCRALCSSKPTAWMQSTVLLARPKLPQRAEHFCHSPTHHLRDWVNNRECKGETFLEVC